MPTEFDDSAHYGVFTTGPNLTSATGKFVRQSEMVLSALRAQGVLDNLVDSLTAPATDQLWLDKNTDPAILKEYDPIGSSWQPMTFSRLFGRAVVTALGNVGGSANAITVDEPDNFISDRLYSITPAATNTGATTIQVTGIGTYNVRYHDGTAIAANELIAGQNTVLLLTGGRFEVLQPFAPVHAAQAAAALSASNASGSATLASEWAEGTEPGGPGTKSAKEHAEDAAAVLQGNLPQFAYTGDGSTVNYALPAAPAAAQNVFLFLSGLPQKANTDYTVSGTTLTFTTAPPNGVEFFGVVVAGVATLNEVADGSVTTPKLGGLAVTTAKLADSSVTTAKMADANVTEAKLAAAFLAKLGLGNEIYPAEYGAVGNNVTNDNTALTNWINAWKGSDPEKDAILTTGTYLTTAQLPNLLNPKGRMIGKGRPRIRYAGSTVTDLVYVQGDMNRYDQYIGNIEIDGNSLTQGLFMTDKVHHSTFENIYLRNCATGFQAMRTIFAVMNTYRNIRCSDNNGGAFDYVPVNGLIVGSGTSAATQTIDCLFEQIILEGIGSTGLALINSWYNTFINGTSEGNGQGVTIAEYSRYNTFIDFFCEVNTSGDFDVQGHSNIFINCEGLSPTNAVTVAGDNNVFIGGRYEDFTITGAAVGTILDNVEILGTYSDSGTGTIVR